MVLAFGVWRDAQVIFLFLTFKKNVFFLFRLMKLLLAALLDKWMPLMLLLPALNLIWLLWSDVWLDLNSVKPSTPDVPSLPKQWWRASEKQLLPRKTKSNFWFFLPSNIFYLHKSANHALSAKFFYQCKILWNKKIA